MKTVCQKCGHANDLGHVFCMKCGTKMDLTRMDETIEVENKSAQIGSVFNVLGIILAIAAVVMLVMGLWPNRPFVPDKKEQLGRRTQIEGLVGNLSQMIAVGIRDTNNIVRIMEPDANAWLEELAKKAQIASLTTRFEKGKCVFRTVRQLGPFPVAQGKITLPALKFSYDVFLGQGSNCVAVTGARVGHLPLPGPTKRPILKLAAKPFEKLTKEQNVYAKITRASVEDGRIDVSVGTGKQ